MCCFLNLQRYDYSLLLKKIDKQMQFNPVDIILLLCFVPAIIVGVMKGFVRQLAGVAALILGIYCSYKFSGYVSTKIAPWIDANQSVVNIIAFIVTFLAVLIVVILIGRAAEGIVKISMLGWLDKLLGVIFAIIKTAFIISMLIFLVDTLNGMWHMFPKEKFADSEVYNLLRALAPKVFPYLKLS